MLSQDSILQAAKLLVQTDGLEGLSMRKLAAGLNVKAMSLYNHIKNKDHLIDLLLDDVVSQIALPRENENWQREMLRRAESAHRVFLESAWSLMPLLSRINSGPSMLRYIDRSLACLHCAGFTLPEADRILHYFDSYIYGFTLIELRFPIQAENYQSTTEEMLPALPKKDYPAMHQLSLILLQGGYDGKQDFVSGIQTILKGLEIELINERRIDDA
ncbi:MAG: TetR/AcrR family transcriptional regulator [Clostridiales bacterium]|nr:TetR/AcrR family transcriptional regulator [Clostridiales bacterium]